MNNRIDIKLDPIAATLSKEAEHAGCFVIPSNGECESLHTGAWIILCIAVWSHPDLLCAQRSLEWMIDNHNRARFRLGVYLFDSYSSINNVFSMQIDSGSPHWIILDDGEMISHSVGLKNLEHLAYDLKPKL